MKLGDLVLDYRFGSGGEPLNAFGFPTDSVSVGPLVLGVPIVLQVRPHGLVADELLPKPFDVDTRPFEPASGLDSIARVHIVVRQEPVIVRDLAVEVGHPSPLYRGPQKLPVESVGERSQTPAVLVSRPQVFELFS